MKLAVAMECNANREQELDGSRAESDEGAIVAED